MAWHGMEKTERQLAFQSKVVTQLLNEVHISGCYLLLLISIACKLRSRGISIDSGDLASRKLTATWLTYLLCPSQALHLPSQSHAAETHMLTKVLKHFELSEVQGCLLVSTHDHCCCCCLPCMHHS